jgi:hypothetical protein
VLGVAAVIGVLWIQGEAWLPLGAGAASGPAVRVKEEPLPVPSASDVWLARAHAQKDKGHLREALAALDAIHPGDKLGPEADKLRGEIQADLLAAARAGEPGAGRPQPQGTARQ